MITMKQEYSIRNNYPVPEDRKSPLDLLIAKEAADPSASGCCSFAMLGTKIPIDAELLIFMADFAARFPDKWLTVKEYIRDGRLSREELAMRLHTSTKTVQRHLRDLRLEAKKWGGSPFVDYSAKINEADGSV